MLNFAPCFSKYRKHNGDTKHMKHDFTPPIQSTYTSYRSFAYCC